jgi:hypothetical protein
LFEVAIFDGVTEIDVVAGIVLSPSEIDAVSTKRSIAASFTAKNV